jgi:hypothetical protein
MSRIRKVNTDPSRLEAPLLGTKVTPKVNDEIMLRAIRQLADLYQEKLVIGPVDADCYGPVFNCHRLRFDLVDFLCTGCFLVPNSTQRDFVNLKDCSGKRIFDDRLDKAIKEQDIEQQHRILRHTILSLPVDSLRICYQKVIDSIFDQVLRKADIYSVYLARELDKIIQFLGFVISREIIKDLEFPFVCEDKRLENFIDLANQSRNQWQRYQAFLVAYGNAFNEKTDAKFFVNTLRQYVVIAVEHRDALGSRISFKGTVLIDPLEQVPERLDKDIYVDRVINDNQDLFNVETFDVGYVYLMQEYPFSTLSLLEPGVTHGITLQRIKSAIKDGGSR